MKKSAVFGGSRRKTFPPSLRTSVCKFLRLPMDEGRLSIPVNLKNLRWYKLPMASGITPPSSIPKYNTYRCRNTSICWNTLQIYGSKNIIDLNFKLERSSDESPLNTTIARGKPLHFSTISLARLSISGTIARTSSSFLRKRSQLSSWLRKRSLWTKPLSSALSATSWLRVMQAQTLRRLAPLPASKL
ncbi:hypothetical protein RDI58_009953 [Solanum bulbocastanum]|uniref:Uncharacterized protein n=1 Tax=Solanum bulbocastanum TaxID=147425 RepID=A0AAN8YFW0_SOLBU